MTIVGHAFDLYVVETFVNPQFALIKVKSLPMTQGGWGVSRNNDGRITQICHHPLVDPCMVFEIYISYDRGGSRILGKGGLINIFTTGGGMPPPVTARGSGGALIAPPVGSGAKPQPLFCFCVYLA